MRIALWIVAGLLAAVFAFTGVVKLALPIAELTKNVQISGGLLRFIGVSELLGRLGLILPSLTRIKPWLTPLAAAGLGLIMILAMGFHISRGEFKDLPGTLVLGGMAAFVAWGRFRKAP